MPIGRHRRCPRARGARRVEEPCHPAAKRGCAQGGAGNDGERRGPRRRRRPPPRAGPCVLAGRAGAGDDVVIAGGFAIEVDAAGEPAHRGVQPANRTCDSLEQLQPVVVPREVRVFVHDHLIERGIVQPLDQSPSDDDDRAAESDCAGARQTFRDPQARQGGARARASQTTAAAAPRARRRRALTCCLSVRTTQQPWTTRTRPNSAARSHADAHRRPTQSGAAGSTSAGWTPWLSWSGRQPGEHVAHTAPAASTRGIHSTADERGPPHRVTSRSIQVRQRAEQKDRESSQRESLPEPREGNGHPRCRFRSPGVASRSVGACPMSSRTCPQFFGVGAFVPEQIEHELARRVVEETAQQLGQRATARLSAIHDRQIGVRAPLLFAGDPALPLKNAKNCQHRIVCGRGCRTPSAR